MNTIRKFEDKDINKIMDIWLKGNLDAHDFIDREYWFSNFQYVKTLLPESDLLIYEENEKVLGFIGIMNNYIAGIFIDEKHRSNGIGHKLLNKAKELYDELDLSVYEKNERAYKFYLKNGFIETNKCLDDNGEVELIMEYIK